MGHVQHQGNIGLLLNGALGAYFIDILMYAHIFCLVKMQTSSAKGSHIVLVVMCEAAEPPYLKYSPPQTPMVFYMYAI